jgi:hypothetical protein
VGHTVFAHPHPEDLDGVVDRIESDRVRREDRASFVAAAAASAPGTTGIEQHRFEDVREQVREAGGWIEEAIEAWDGHSESHPPDPALGRSVEITRGAPETPGWPVE